MDPNQPSTSDFLIEEEEEYGNILEQGSDVPEVEEYDFDDDDDTNGIIAGIDTKPHLTGLHNGSGNRKRVEEPAEAIDDEELVNAINRFMRNEYDYDQFMRVTGGQTLKEELGAKQKRSARNNVDDEVEEIDTADDDEEEDDEDVELMEDVEEVSTSQHAGSSYSFQSAGPSDRYDALPEEARYIMTQMMSGKDEGQVNHSDEMEVEYEVETEEREPPPLKQVKIEGQKADSTSTETPATNAEPRDRGKLKRLDAMLGQANVLAARGNITDAMEILREVIKQDHKHAIAYQQIATVYEQLGDHQKALQFGLLASHLDPKTPPDDWVHWGDEAEKFGMIEEAAVCYDRAIHLNNENWKFYEKRIEMLDRLNLRPLAMRTRLQAAQLINNEILQVDFEWFHDLIRKVAQYYITMNDEEKAIQSLEAFVLRSKEFERDAEPQHETLIGMYLAKSKFRQAGMSILAMCNGVKAIRSTTKDPACLITYTNGTYECLPFPPVGSDIDYDIDVNLFPVSMHCHLVICLFSLDEVEQSSVLEHKLLKRNFNVEEDEGFILDVPRLYKNRGHPKLAMNFLDQLTKNPCYNNEASGAYWYLKGSLEMMQKHDDLAMEAFNKVLILQPDHIDNRIHLSTLQQKSGFFEKALETLENYDLENCSSMPDERLLARRADVLFEAGDSEQFVRITRMMLAPHFYKVYISPDILKKRRVTKGKTTTPALSNTLKTCAFGVVKHTNWERLVKRLGATVEANGTFQTSLSGTDIHDYCLKLIECLNKMEKHQDALIVCCYAFLHPTLFKADKISTFQNLVYFCAIKARCWNLAFEYVRFFHTFSLAVSDPQNGSFSDVLQKRLFNAMNYVFVNSQNVCYHRFIMRALVKAKDNHALQAISGNNSLITGTYRHAMGEYLRVWVANKRNPLICMLLALTFTHMSCKKDLSSRHLIGIRGIAFMKKYSKARACQQEVFYNIARMFHQMSILPLAKHFYDKVLEVDPPCVFDFDEDGNEVIIPAMKYDLRKMAAHNLALIYRTSGNNFAARKIYEKYLVV